MRVGMPALWRCAGVVLWLRVGDWFSRMGHGYRLTVKGQCVSVLCLCGGCGRLPCASLSLGWDPAGHVRWPGWGACRPAILVGLAGVRAGLPCVLIWVGWDPACHARGAGWVACRHDAGVDFE